MSFRIDEKVTVEVSEYLKSKSDIERQIEEEKSNIQSIQMELFGLVAASPRDIVDLDNADFPQSRVELLKHVFNEIIEQYESSLYNLYK